MSAKFGHVSFTLGTRSGARGGAEQPSSSSLRVLLVGDFSGRDQNASGSERPRPIDIDRIDGALASLGATLSLPPLAAGGRGVELTPQSLEELHPDHLLTEVPDLAELVRLKNALPRDPAAAARLTEILGSAPAGADVDPPSGVREAGAESGDQTLSRLLGTEGRRPRESERAPAPARELDVQRLVKSLIGGLAGASAPPPDTTALASAAEHTIGERLRAILRNERFRALESAWRSVDRLVRNSPDEEQIRYFLLDVAPARLAQAPAELERLLEGGFSVVVLDQIYRPDAFELEGLARLLEICSARGASIIAGAHSELAGCAGFDRSTDPDHWTRNWPDSVTSAWERIVRARENGAALALALPRFLLRQPYGSSGETLEAMRFEEILDQGEHEAFAWGNGAYLIAQAVAELRASGGDGAHADGSVDVRELPVVHLDGEEEVQIKPCAEAWLSDRAVGRLLSDGFSVLHGLRDSDRIRVHL